jgi:hypothetical protein
MARRKTDPRIMLVMERRTWRIVDLLAVTGKRETRVSAQRE